MKNKETAWQQLTDCCSPSVYSSSFLCEMVQNSSSSKKLTWVDYVPQLIFFEELDYIGQSISKNVATVKVKPPKL